MPLSRAAAPPAFTAQRLDGPAPPGPDAQQAPTQLLDDPQEWPAFGRRCRPDGRPLPADAGDAADAQTAIWESHLVLEGMRCTACALSIEAALCAVPGVLRAEVSSAACRARVLWNAARVRPSQWLAAVQRAGYRALPALDAQARAQQLRQARNALWRWLAAGFCMMQVMMYAWPAYVARPGDLSPESEQLLRWASWVITLALMVFCCAPFFASALRDLRLRRIGMDLPVALGMALTFAVSSAGTFDPAGLFGREVYYDSLAMFVFFLLSGRLLELRLRARSAGALDAVLNRLPESVQRRCAQGLERVALRRMAVGDTLRVLPGEAFAADGRITWGDTQADEALLTGESTPVARPLGSRVLAGSYNLRAPVDLLVERLGRETRFAHIVALMESAALQKPRLALLADRIARPFLLAVLAAAALAAAWWWRSDPGHALMVAVAVLIVTCPCALSLATPAAMLAAAGSLARQGVLVRNLQALEALAAVDTVVFDKTGTLTHEAMALRAVHPLGDMDAGAALALAAALARESTHPAARALVAAADRAAASVSAAPAPQRWLVDALREDAGLGLSATVRDAASAQQAPQRVRLGAAQHAGVQHAGVAAPGAGSAGDDGTAPQVLLARERADGSLVALARFDLAEQLRSDAAAVVQALARAGVQVRILSGDRIGAVLRAAQQAGIASARAQGAATPQHKLSALRALQAAGRRVAMVGDGLNDGPVLAAADVSFAFGSAVPLARARADFVLPAAALAPVAQTLWLARRTLAVVRQNLCWAALYNALCVPLAVAGAMPAWLAGLGMALSSLLVVLNAARLARALPALPAAPEAMR